jgi:hypothetical protein
MSIFNEMAFATGAKRPLITAKTAISNAVFFIMVPFADIKLRRRRLRLYLMLATIPKLRAPSYCREFREGTQNASTLDFSEKAKAGTL